MKLLNKTLGIIAASVVLLLVGFIIGYAVFPHDTSRSGTSTEKASSGDEAVMSEKELNNKIKPLEEDTISILCCGVDNSEKLTDVIMYAVFDTKKKSVNILRIPRDSFVGRDFPTSKINAIYGHPYDNMDGAESLKKYLQEKWKLDIDYYATVTLEGMRKMIDDLGGITMNIEQNINYLPGKVLYPGEQVLDGEKSEWFIRYRAGYNNGDLGRIDAQTKFLGACIDTVKDKGRLKCLSVLQKNYKSVKTDMPLDKMIAIAGNFFELEKSDLNMFVVPGKGTMYYSYSVYEVDEAGLVEILNDNFVSMGNELTVDELEVAAIYGQSTGNNYTPSTNYNDTNDYSNPDNQEQPDAQNEVPGQEKLYEYDENGNPLYKYDENGNPIYNYDENGNVVYIYQLENQNANKPADTNQTEDSLDKSSTKNNNEASQENAKNANQEDKKGGLVVKKTDEKAEEENGIKVVKKNGTDADSNSGN